MRASKWLAIAVAVILPFALTTGVFNGLSFLGVILTIGAVCAEFEWQARHAPYGDDTTVGEWAAAATVWEETQ